MKPIEHMSPMTALDFTACLPNSDMTLPLHLQAVALFLQKDIGQHGQRPEAHNGYRTHQLILIQVQLFFAIAKEHLNLPARGDMHEQELCRRLQIAGSEVTRLRERGIQRVAHDHYLTAV